ncbi:peptidoglycan-recognition protein LF-like [Macrosteles quadrilineatus]|uniref:peptidoglycan-recognition protein LF-like n=1 Tax=Macrosteles quadrilineatus TaxID=74068 RepID=UPI0023E1A513|nr:peptidoglycan-recognition protein LF-like [Macrosteles quadrilineatus]
MQAIQGFFKSFFKNAISSATACEQKALPIYPPELNIVMREQWRAEPAVMGLPDDPLLHLENPVKNIFLNDTATLMCDDLEECTTRLRKIQWNHQDGGYPDITHNFMIGTEGTVYVGRGWDWHPDAMRFAIKGDVIDIAFIGNFERLDPLPVMMEAAEKLIAHGVKLNKVQANYTTTWFRDYESSWLKVE